MATAKPGPRRAPTPRRSDRGARAVREAPSQRFTTTETWYIESSALVAALLEGDSSVRHALTAPGRHVTSAITLAEANRAIVRASTARRLTALQERTIARELVFFSRRCAIIAVTDEVLTRAGQPFPHEPVRTLDAIHLATLEALGEPPQLISVITRDARVERNARALGYSIA